jgi:hypothetical protein
MLVGLSDLALEKSFGFFTIPADVRDAVALHAVE